MAQHRGKVHAVMVGVGAAFDFHAGIVQRAPAWMQSRGLEWLYRLLKDPRRLFDFSIKVAIKSATPESAAGAASGPAGAPPAKKS